MAVQTECTCAVTAPIVLGAFRRLDRVLSPEDGIGEVSSQARPEMRHYTVVAAAAIVCTSL